MKSLARYKIRPVGIMIVLSLIIIVNTWIYYYYQIQSKSLTHVYTITPNTAINNKFYITFTPYGRWSNRYYQIVRGLQTSFHFNRTLILIDYENHDLSLYYNLDKINRDLTLLHQTMYGEHAINKPYKFVISWSEFIQTIGFDVVCLHVDTIYCRDQSCQDNFKTCQQNYIPFMTEHVTNVTNNLLINNNNPLLVLSGQAIWNMEFSVPQHQYLFYPTFHDSVWDLAKTMIRSLKRPITAFHIRLEDLTFQTNLTQFLIQQQKPTHGSIFIGTNGNAQQIQEIRHYFPNATIECTSICNKDPITTIAVNQAISILADHFISNIGMSSTYSALIVQLREQMKNQRHIARR